MRCRDARAIIAGLKNRIAGLTERHELIEHLRECPRCARDFWADKTLQDILAEAAVDDTKDIMPLDRIRNDIEIKAGQPGSSAPLRRPSWIKLVFAKPTLSFTTVLAILVIAIAALVPFEFSHTVGYTVTMDGIHKNLAGDIERVCNILSAVGLEDTEVDILSCDSTCRGADTIRCDPRCRLKFVDLKSEEEVDRIIDAFSHYSPDRVTSNIITIRATSTRTLLHKANEAILQ